MWSDRASDLVPRPPPLVPRPLPTSPSPRPPLTVSRPPPLRPLPLVPLPRPPRLSATPPPVTGPPYRPGQTKPSPSTLTSADHVRLDGHRKKAASFRAGRQNICCKVFLWRVFLCLLSLTPCSDAATGGQLRCRWASHGESNGPDPRFHAVGSSPTLCELVAPDPCPHEEKQ